MHPPVLGSRFKREVQDFCILVGILAKWFSIGVVEGAFSILAKWFSIGVGEGAFSIVVGVGEFSIDRPKLAMTEDVKERQERANPAVSSFSECLLASFCKQTKKTNETSRPMCSFPVSRQRSKVISSPKLEGTLSSILVKVEILFYCKHKTKKTLFY